MPMSGVQRILGIVVYETQRNGMQMQRVIDK